MCVGVRASGQLQLIFPSALERVVVPEEFSLLR